MHYEYLMANSCMCPTFIDLFVNEEILLFLCHFVLSEPTESSEWTDTTRRR